MLVMMVQGLETAAPAMADAAPASPSAAAAPTMADAAPAAPEAAAAGDDAAASGAALLGSQATCDLSRVFLTCASMCKSSPASVDTDI